MSYIDPKLARKDLESQGVNTATMRDEDCVSMYIADQVRQRQLANTPREVTQRLSATDDASCRYCGHKLSMVKLTTHAVFNECPRCRDEFARAALTGALTNCETMETVPLRGGIMPKVTAEWAYVMADAMLAARKVKSQS